MLNPAARLCSICVILLYVYPCAYTCASLQTPAEGLKMPSHPQRQQSPNTSVTDPSFYCSYISFPPHLPLYFIIFSSHPSNSISHLPRPFTLFFFFIISRPFLSSSLCSRYLFSSRSSLPSVSQRFAFCVRYPYHNPLVSPPFFFFLFPSLLFPVSELSSPLFTSIVTRRGR